jgi:hypothetical protein
MVGGGRRLGVAVALAAAVAGASACTADPTGGRSVRTEPEAASPAAPIPLSEDAVGPGGPIAEGFVVPDGAWLLAGAVPSGAWRTDDGDLVVDRGWTAHLAVPGDPRPVLRSIIDQAGEQGFKLRPDHSRGQVSWRDVPFCSWMDDVYTCQASGFDGDQRGARELRARFNRAPAVDGRPPVSHMTITLADIDPPRTPQLEPFGTPANPMGPEPPSVDDDWPALAGRGDQLGGAFGPRDMYRFRIEPGSRLVAPPFSPDGWSWNRYVAVLVITGDVEEAVAAYRAQHPNRDLGEPWTSPDGTRVSRFGDGGAGGPDYGITVVEREREPAILLIDAGYD